MVFAMRSGCAKRYLGDTRMCTSIYINLFVRLMQASLQKHFLSCFVSSNRDVADVEVFAGRCPLYMQN